MRVLFDVDGVLANWMGAVSDVVEQACGQRPDPEKHAGWFRLKNIPGISSTEKRYIEDCLNAPQFVEDLGVLEGAQAGVERIAKLPGVELAFVTAQWDSPTWMYERVRWLKKHGFLKMQDNAAFVATRHKYLVAPGLLIDDKPKNIMEYNDKAVGGRGVLWHTDWNTADPLRKFTQVIHSWDALYEEVNRCLKSQQ